MSITPTTLSVQIDPEALQQQVAAAIQETKRVWASDLLGMALALDPEMKDRLIEEWTEPKSKAKPPVSSIQGENQ